MTAITLRWFAFLRVEDRSGASAALTGVFSERGVSFGSLSTLDVHDGIGTMSVEFSASERLAHVLVRTLERLAVVRTVALVRADDPGVRAVAVLSHADDARLPEALAVARDAGTTVVAGPLADVEWTVADQRDAGATLVAVTVLPPAADAG